MAPRRVERSASFAATVAEPRDASTRGTAETIPNLADQAEFTDEDGVVWRRRGTGSVERKRLRRLMGDPSVRMLHEHLGKVTDVPPGERSAFWTAALESMARYPTSNFVASEFENEARVHLLVVHELC